MAILTHLVVVRRRTANPPGRWVQAQNLADYLARVGQSGEVIGRLRNVPEGIRLLTKLHLHIGMFGEDVP